jgi:hypothetical protein
MHGNLEPEERVWGDQGLMDQIQTMIDTLGWEMTDDIVLEVGGTSVYEIEGAGTKWAPVKGTRKYNKDAFLVIKNRSRDPIVPSQPNPELKQHHA